ncbi:MAG: sigma-70 family RNA polymerase sigma factor [Planctomycetes bacterium]|nr:sigma-70 family RNA polymerase sigma factor [Planctomycetota bacterium]
MDSTSATLLHRLRQPTNQSAWNQFVRLYTPLLFYWAHKAGLSEADSADLVQDVFCVLLRKLPEFEYDAGQSFRAWLRTVLLNTRRNRARQRVIRTAGGIEDSDHEPAVPDGLVELAEADYRRHLIARAVQLMQAEFEPATWQACWQVTVEGRPPAEVARELGLSTNAVYLAKSRVLARLRRELDGLLE